jgi:hypothetical protein
MRTIYAVYEQPFYRVTTRKPTKVGARFIETNSRKFAKQFIKLNGFDDSRLFPLVTRFAIVRK